MSFRRIGMVYLGLVLALVLIMAMPVSTAESTEVIPKETGNLSETMLEASEIMNEELQENIEVIETSHALKKEFITKEAIEETVAEEDSIEEDVTEETIEVETEVELEFEVEEITSVENTEVSEEEPEEVSSEWQGVALDAYNGVVQGPNGKETYYNLPMEGVIEIMKFLGYDYEYGVREDGVKMYGPYIMCAANLEIRPKGTILETSLGTAMVCDTGGFAESNPYQIDIAVDW